MKIDTPELMLAYITGAIRTILALGSIDEITRETLDAIENDIHTFTVDGSIKVGERDDE